MRAKDALGKYGENVAARLLTSSGFEVLDRNWRCDIGEIDIVARDGKQLVVCEVKTRSSLTYGHPLEAVDARKVLRLQHLGHRWMAAHGIHATVVRVDVVAIVRPRSGPQSVEHLRGVA